VCDLELRVEKFFEVDARVRLSCQFESFEVLDGVLRNVLRAAPLLHEDQLGQRAQRGGQLRWCRNGVHGVQALARVGIQRLLLLGSQHRQRRQTQRIHLAGRVQLAARSRSSIGAIR